MSRLPPECFQSPGVTNPQTSGYIEWLYRNAPPRDAGFRMTRREVRHQARLLATDKHCAGSLLGFFAWRLLHWGTWMLIVKVVEWWFSTRETEVPK